MDFTNLCMYLEAKKGEFSLYQYKLANREIETKVLAPYVSSLPKHLQVFSFPYEYAFEENLINRFNKTMSIWSGEKLNNTELSETWLNAKRFLRSHPKCKVYLPSRVIHGKIYPLSRNDKQLSLFKILNKETKMAEVDFSRFHVIQKLVNLPEKFDIIDLDYVRSLDIENSTWNKMAWGHLKPGGILYTTFSLSAYRALNVISKKYSGDIDQKELNKYERENVLKEPETKYITINPKNFKKFGLENEKLYQGYENMVNNYINLHYDSFNAAPVFVNIYRGGSVEESGKFSVMCRLIWVKGETGEEILTPPEKYKVNVSLPKTIENKEEEEETETAISIKPEYKRKTVFEKHKDQILKMYFDQKMTTTQIASKLGVSDVTIGNVIRQSGRSLRKPKELPIDQILDMYFNKNMTTYEIAELLGASSASRIRNLIIAQGLTLRERKPPVTPRMNLPVDQILDLYFNQNMSTYEIAKIFNVSYSTIIDFIRRSGHSIKPRKLLPELPLDEILDMYFNKNMSTYEIGKLFNVSHTAIGRLIKLNGKTLRNSNLPKPPIIHTLPVDQILDMYFNKNMSTYEIARKFNVSHASIGRLIKKSGKKLRSEDLPKAPIIHTLPVDQILDMYFNKNMTTYEIAQKFNVSNVTIGRLITKSGKQLRTSGQARKLTKSSRLSS